METKRTPEIPEYLTSSHPDTICYGSYVEGCVEAVKQNPVTGRWFITMGHPGFNSMANNRDGYVSMDSARTAVRRYAGRR